MFKKPINLITCFATLLFAISAAWAVLSHFGECNRLSADELFSTCMSLLPDAGFNQIDTAPEFRHTIELPHVSSRITRVSDNTYFEVDNGGAVHGYSRRQAWNTDESLLVIGDKVLSTDKLEFLLKYLPVSSERVWSNTNPDIMFGLQFIDDVLNRFVSFNLRSGEVTELVTLDALTTCSIGRGEGSQSNDDQFVVFVCGEHEGSAEIVSFNIQERKIVGHIVLNEYVNWASVSQSAKYVVVESGIEKGAPRRLTRYSIDLTESEHLSDERHHGDLGIDVNGDDVFVMIGDRYISYIRLKDGLVTQLPVSGFIRKASHGHVSCRNINRPGWCYISTYNNVVGAVRLEASQNWLGIGVPSFGTTRGVAVFEHWGHHESSSGNYPSTPKASASPSGRQVIISSDWRGSGETNDFVLIRP